MTAEQVLHCAIVKQLHPFSYEKLAFHLADWQEILHPQFNPLSSPLLWKADGNQCSRDGGASDGKDNVLFLVNPTAPQPNH